MSSLPISIPNTGSSTSSTSPASSYDSNKSSASRMLTYTRDELLALAPTSPFTPHPHQYYSTSSLPSSPVVASPSMIRSLEAFPEIFVASKSSPRAITATTTTTTTKAGGGGRTRPSALAGKLGGLTLSAKH